MSEYDFRLILVDIKCANKYFYKRDTSPSIRFLVVGTLVKSTIPFV